MIAFLKGNVIKKTIDYLIIDVNGVGYKVFAPISTLCKIDSQSAEISIYIETIVREDAINLYGFFTENEKDIFNKLITVSKVGPKLALAILSGLDKDKIILAIKEKNIKLLSSIPGVGKKTAERICIDLKDKFNVMETEDEGNLPVKDANIENDVISALVTLGYKQSEIKSVVAKIVKLYPDKSIENLLKIVLNELYNG